MFMQSVSLSSPSVSIRPLRVACVFAIGLTALAFAGCDSSTEDGNPGGDGGSDVLPDGGPGGGPDGGPTGDGTCYFCHGDADSPAPPKDLDGNTDTASPGVGAHRAHLAESDWHLQVTCNRCHVVPASQGEPQHIDGDGQAELTFDDLNSAATYDFGTVTCQSLYCHGNGRSDSGSMVWTADTTMVCGSCHEVSGGDNLSGRHRRHLNRSVACASCHQDVVNNSMTITGPDLHVNGTPNVSLSSGSYNESSGQCSGIACHGSETW